MMTPQGLSRYPGGKGLAYRDIINLMPPHERYIETHLGSAAVFRNKRAAARSIGMELDRDVVARWRLRGSEAAIEVVHGDAVTLLPEIQLTPTDLIYCDPPYHPATRKRRRCYRHDYGIRDHERLLALLVTLPCMVLISGYRNDLYDDVLSGWSRSDYLTLTHDGQVIESAWTNYRPGPSLHDYRYIGSDFRERERLRRRTSSLARRIERSGDLELHAALAQIAVSRPQALLAAAERIRG